MPKEDASQTILEATDRLTEMVGDVLYISRIDAISKPAMESTDIHLLIEDRISRHKALADSKNLKIKFNHDSKPVIINCASSYMGRALDNLIANAIRFANEDITVDCFRVGSRVVIRVSDDGPGFEPEILPNAFERFIKGKNGQTGIGLAVVRSIAEQHKGTVDAENGTVGAKLTINMPHNL
jgi:signal transduction histidine kinase